MSPQGGGNKKTPKVLVKLLSEAVSKSSQSAVARDTGLTQSAIGRYLKGIGEPTTATLQKLAGYFGVSPLKLRGDSIFDQMPAGDYYGKMASTIDVILRLALESKLAEKNRLFLLSAVSVAKIITDMPEELRDIYERDYIDDLHKIAETVIEKYSGADLFERYISPRIKSVPELKEKKV